MTYAPPTDQLDRYARLLVDYALGGGDGIAAGDVVAISAEESAKPLYGAACRAIWRAGGNVISQYSPDNTPELNIGRDFFEIAGESQIDYFAERHMHGLIEDADHLLRIHAEAYPRALAGIDPTALVRNRRARRRLNEWIDEKESAGRSRGRSRCTGPRRWPPRRGCRSTSTGARSSRRASSRIPIRSLAGARSRGGSRLTARR